MLAALDHPGHLNQTAYKLASAFADGHFTPGALEFNFREWRQETRKLAAEKGIEAAGKVRRRYPSRAKILS